LFGVVRVLIFLVFEGILSMDGFERQWVLHWSHPEFGMVVYCNDKKFRRFFHWGTMPNCVKIYSSPNWALRVVRFMHGEFTATRIDKFYEMIGAGKE
jgi:hypothetical protein